MKHIIMLPGHPHAGRARYIRINLRQEMHTSLDRFFQMNSNNALANHLLKLSTHSTVISSNNALVTPALRALLRKIHKFPISGISIPYSCLLRGDVFNEW